MRGGVEARRGEAMRGEGAISGRQIGEVVSLSFLSVGQLLHPKPKPPASTLEPASPRPRDMIFRFFLLEDGDRKRSALIMTLVCAVRSTCVTGTCGRLCPIDHALKNSTLHRYLRSH